MRTWLFVPGHDRRKLEKALQSSAEVVVVDWEDAVPPERKHVARETMALVATGATPPRIIIRINAVDSADFAADCAALTGSAATGVMLPKVAKPEDVQMLAAATHLHILPLLESAAGVEHAFAIAQSHPQIERLIFGPLDLLADLGVTWQPQNPVYHYAQSRLAFAGRAAGLAGPIDGVWPDLNDVAGLRRESAAARSLGYVGKLVIHPGQLAVVQEVFSPTAAELAEARAVVAAFQAARSRGESAVRLGNRLIDPPVVLWAERILAYADESPAQ
jgi:citrate lyase beta subunit